MISLADKQREAALLAGVRQALSLPAAMHCDATPLVSVDRVATPLASVRCSANWCTAGSVSSG